jgi:pimeloyl-ACP methyl ester carboxylesterase/dienelactone hydrolase
MAEVLLFHHALGQTKGFTTFADELRRAGHIVHTPDLYDGRTFAALDEGLAYAQQVGFPNIIERGVRAASQLPDKLVYAGFSLGVLPAQKLAQTRAGARGALLFYSCVPASEFGTWPAGVPVQIHGMDADPIFVNEGDLDAARALVASVEQAELFLYPGRQHYFADSSLPSYDAAATALLTRRVLEFLRRDGATESVAASGATLVVETRGNGDPVVFVHGFADDRRSWDLIASPLCRERRVVRYDLRGYGESFESGQTRFRHADDLRLVLDTLKIERCDLVGVSMGGGISLNFSLDSPERVRRLILISPAVVGWQWSEQWRALWAKIREAASHDLPQARELWWNHPLFSPTREHQVAGDILRKAISQYSGKHWLRDNEARAMPDLDRLHTLRVPTLLITGTRDFEDFRLIADLIEAAAPGVSRIDLDGAGHLPHLERPAEVIDQVSAFLG